ncbi:unnamed protein product [Effrenium voratum]|nr:unnamed protein product [Effrenium voratum]
MALPAQPQPAQPAQGEPSQATELPGRSSEVSQASSPAPARIVSRVTTPLRVYTRKSRHSHGSKSSDRVSIDVDDADLDKELLLLLPGPRPFIESAYRGPRAGYYFSTGDRGLGYYSDVKRPFIAVEQYLGPKEGYYFGTDVRGLGYYFDLKRLRNELKASGTSTGAKVKVTTCASTSAEAGFAKAAPVMTVVEVDAADAVARNALVEVRKRQLQAQKPPAKRQAVDAEKERLPATPQRRSTGFTEAAPPSPTSVQRSRRPESCSICCEDFEMGAAVRLSCGHGWYCAECLRRHAEARLEMGAVDVCCPQCNTAIAERTLRSVLPTTLVEQLLRRSLEQAVSAAADLYACPTPNCAFRVALEDGDVPRLRCPECKKTCCLLCGAQPYHRGRSCEENARLRPKRGSGESALRRWMESAGAKQCPTCHAIVTKQNLEKQNTQYVECHKMMCRNCETKFCFKCLMVLSGKPACSCSRAEHGFINPKTGRRLNHVKAKARSNKN